MSGTYIRADLRRRVRERARFCCEYCGIGEEDTFLGCEVDHIVSEKHGGLMTEGNLAFACFLCNRNKGSDLGSLSPNGEGLVRFFNPRIDKWQDHFHLATDGVTILTDTNIGEVTARLFRFNAPERLAEREELRQAGRRFVPPDDNDVDV